MRTNGGHLTCMDLNILAYTADCMDKTHGERLSRLLIILQEFIECLIVTNGQLPLAFTCLIWTW